ncbi:complement component C9 [Thunnus maccoyii]|uniref:complement component C9 n=1 Tax=Thunnus maccoyii TaxID=8240 RepID=UPI001C4CF7C1|nr:complement component C9 [Thunnus maccoyii]
MRLEVALPLGFFGLCLTLVLLGEGMGEVIPDPPPVNCQWSPWLDWSHCDPCTKVRRRSRSVRVFAQFGGSLCLGSIGERESCIPAAECNQTPWPVCSDSEFECETGYCIKKRLSCNGDLDCEDGSDEECDPGRKPCGEETLQNNEQARTAGYGINVLGLEPRMNPFFNDYFNGRCDRVRNPTTRQYDRLPWNVGVLNYQTQVEETASKEIYEDTYSLLREILTEESFKISGGVTGSFKFSPSEGSMSNATLNVNLEGEYKQSKMIKEITEIENVTNKSFMRVKGRLQLSTYRMRSRDLQVADEFLAHVRSLPLQYEKGIYFAFLEDYGTHYTKNGKSGGEYELVYVLNHDTMVERRVTAREFQKCFTLGVKADLTGKVVEGKANVDIDSCKDVKPNETKRTDGKALVDEVITAVKGGDLESAGNMRAKLDQDGVMDIDTYRAWARTIPDIPALLSSEPEPIYMLIPLDMPGADTRISNLKQATEDYVAEYNVCKCKPCHNGGTVTLLDGKCICLCPVLFEGAACQNLKQEKSKHLKGKRPLTQEGNWTCWSGWSECSGEKRTRTRSCNQDGLSGAVCRGDTVIEEPCRVEM